ncbi:arsenic resistance protein [Sinobaca qinghaiensis]|uniref:arsenic resistance protein n=1 Tax=Sinobaca qinghaiensis TaxID=342944 RepID=UPI000E762673|nr:arsenic resistance protein [Sinobaca qinghaiensis]
MNLIEKWHTIFLLSAIGMGLIIGQWQFIESRAGLFILPFLFCMLYGLFLAVPLQHLGKAFTHIRFFSASAGINFIWTPVLAYGLGAVFLSNHPALWLGFIILMVTPCTDWYLIFTSTAKGNVPLAASILPVNLILQLLLLPVYLYLFAGTIEGTNLYSIGSSILLVVILPFSLAQLTRYIFKRRKAVLEQQLVPFFSKAQGLFLALAIMAMFASQGKVLLDNLEITYLLLIPILLFYVINFFTARLAGKWLHFSYKDTVSLHLSTLARNSPLALAVAVTAFPNQPLIALVLVIGPLIELPVLAVVSQVLLLRRNLI